MRKNHEEIEVYGAADDNISSLVRKGLEVEIQQSMDLRQVLPTLSLLK